MAKITINPAQIYPVFGIVGTPKRLPRKLKKRLKKFILRALEYGLMIEEKRI